MNNHVPSEQQSVSEITIRAVILGIIIAVVMCAANVYIGLKAGMTVCASIPAAVISMGILRGIMKKGSILENNMVQTIGSSGESLAAGIIFTMPALVMAGIWDDFHYWTVTLVALSGGVLGVFFMIPLRRALVIEQKELAYPEGVACAEVLRAGEHKGHGVIYLLVAIILGIVFKILVSAVVLIKGSVHGALKLGHGAIGFGCDISIALVAVGYIVGFNIAVLVFLGGALAWFLAIPVFSMLHGLPEAESLYDACTTIWNSQIRYMGVGAMVVGGIWSIIQIRKGIVQSVKQIFDRYAKAKTKATDVQVARTEQELGMLPVLIGLSTATVLIFFLYRYLTGSLTITIVSTIAMVISAFFFVAVASYITGLVGSSNNPVSGMTICTILFVSLLFYLFKMTGPVGMLATLGVAGVVCCAACTAGDICQDLKTGHLVGATPRKQQIMQLVGVVITAFVIAPVLNALHHGYGIGSATLPAPQASLFKGITESIFISKEALPWFMLAIGVGIAGLIIILDEILKASGSKFRLYVMPVAVGIYLPIMLSVPILIGGITALIVTRIAQKKSPEAAKNIAHRGLVFSSGLLAGEALIGVVIGIIISLTKVPGKTPFLPIKVIENDLLTVIFFTLMIFILGWVALKGKKTSAEVANIK